MPVIKSSSKQAISANIGELIKTKPGKTRAKGIRTLAKRRNISRKKAQEVQAKAIALSQ